MNRSDLVAIVVLVVAALVWGLVALGWTLIAARLAGLV